MLKVEEVPTGCLLPYAHNAKIHTDEQVTQIANSISEFGFNDPVGVWDGPAGTEIVEGHGRVLAAQRLGIEKAPVVRLDHLSDSQRRAYAHAHNQLTMSTGWDFAELEAEMARLPEFDFEGFGFEAGEDLSRGFEELSTEGRAKSEGYDDFVGKFEPKLTTDDCYTPKAVYDAVLGWASAEYGFDPRKAVRPFYPGGDYEAFDYPEGCVVVDNPPFSMLAAIVRFYMGRGIPFFLFAPALTPFTASGECRYLPVAADVTYENGAKVRTSFVTSMGGLEDRHRARAEGGRGSGAAGRIGQAAENRIPRRAGHRHVAGRAGEARRQVEGEARGVPLRAQARRAGRRRRRHLRRRLPGLGTGSGRTGGGRTRCGRTGGARGSQRQRLRAERAREGDSRRTRAVADSMA